MYPGIRTLGGTLNLSSVSQQQVNL